MTVGDFLYEVWDLIVIGLIYLWLSLMWVIGYIVAPIVFCAIGCYLAILVAVETGVL